MKIMCLGLMICLFPVFAEAICLKNCQQQIPAAGSNNSAYEIDSINYRERSHDTGDVRNSVMGDVNIKVGHERLDIRMDANSSNNSVNASVSSTIILGDIKK